MLKSFKQLHTERQKTGHNPGAEFECFDPNCYARNYVEVYPLREVAAEQFAAVMPRVFSQVLNKIPTRTPFL